MPHRLAQQRMTSSDLEQRPHCLLCSASFLLYGLNTFFYVQLIVSIDRRWQQRLAAVKKHRPGVSTRTIAMPSLLPLLTYMSVSVNLLCLSSALSSLHQQHGSVCHHFYSWSPIFLLPNVRRTRNSCGTWRASVLSFRTCANIRNTTDAKLFKLLLKTYF